MLEQILERSNLLRAWKRVRSNGGAGGVDGIGIDDFPAWLRRHWPRIKASILDGSYRPRPVRRHEIPKRSGGKRKLGIPTLIDRVIQQAILQILQPIVDPDFSESSYGFRPGRSAHQAVRRVRAILNEGYTWVVDLDLEKFFDRVNHDVLMCRVSRKVSDKRVLRLIGGYLRAGVQVDGAIRPTTEGVPQGGPLSPVLTNILLDDLDKELESRGHRFVRYADDFVILVKSKRAARRAGRGIVRFLRDRLKLEINRQKSRIVAGRGCEFLGFTFPGGRIVWSAQSLENFKYQVRRLTSRSWGISMQARLEKLSRYIRGWMNYFALSQYYRVLPELDEWIRRRVRMCYVKQWRRPRTRTGHLLRLGVAKRQAIALGMSSKGPWRLARTYATQLGMSNQWLSEQGLVSVRQLWIGFHYHK